MLKTLDLFCGCGGLSLGFEEAGFEISAGIDNDQEALETFAKNFKKAKTFNVDLSNKSQIPFDQIGEIDVILGGPPCQGFSIAGKRQAEDPRNKLTDAYINIVNQLNPKAVLIENVPNILNMANGSFRENITEMLEKLGFKVSIEKLNSVEFGVPQNRRRVFFIGVKDDYIRSNEIDKLKSKNIITCGEALDDLPTLEHQLGDDAQSYAKEPQNEYQSLMRLKTQLVFNHISVDHKETTKSIIAQVPDGGNYKDLPLNLQSTRKVNIAWTRMNSNKPCFTIDAGHNHHFHYKQNRVPTVRECGRIQSFPDHFIFTGKRTSQYRQVGNAVPPLLAKTLGKLIQGHIFR